jgi:hypothetical protein
MGILDEREVRSGYKSLCTVFRVTLKLLYRIYYCIFECHSVVFTPFLVVRSISFHLSSKFLSHFFPNQMPIRNITYNLFLAWSLWLAAAAAIIQTLGDALNCHAQTYFPYCSQLFMVANQGFADLYTHICAYSRNSVREARGWIGWRPGRGLSARPVRPQTRLFDHLCKE